jgi:NAD(P)-dependent dehydrogenase (short-subunit alcohol dehydrogenase family)
VSQDFVGQTALITGSTSGIGRAGAEQFAARGAHVIISGRDKTRGDAVVAMSRGPRTRSAPVGEPGRSGARSALRGVR